jgi:hypothetical protein
MCVSGATRTERVGLSDDLTAERTVALFTIVSAFLDVVSTHLLPHLHPYEDGSFVEAMNVGYLSSFNPLMISCVVGMTATFLWLSSVIGVASFLNS